MEPLHVTAKELARWRQRMHEIEALIRDAADEEARLQEELVKVEKQMEYYGHLAGDMKRDVQPPSLSGFLRSMRW